MVMPAGQATAHHRKTLLRRFVGNSAIWRSLVRVWVPAKTSLVVALADCYSPNVWLYEVSNGVE